jgi:glycosyltransferase involved in cell wall biosynthesis
LTGGGLWLGFFGRLVPEKGLNGLLDALARVPEQRLLVVGSGPERDALEAQARALGLADRVRFLGSVKSEDVAAYLKAIDVLCLPSLTRGNWKEQFGRVLIEAMAAEAVVVGSSSGEIPRVIADAGLVFPEGDAGALADRLLRLAGSAELRQDLRIKGAARVRMHYTNDVVAARWGELWARAGAGENPPP